MTEEWKEYKNYFISNFGQIRDKKTGKTIDIKNRNDTKTIGGVGLHRIVYSLFIGEIPTNYNICFKDKDIFNCHVENLIALKGKEFGKDCKTKRRFVSFNDFLERAKKTHGDKYIYKEGGYKSINQRVEIICPKHGVFKQVGSDHCNGHGCRECNFEKRKTWSQQEDEFLIKNYQKLGALDCSLQLKKTKTSIYRRAKFLKLVENNTRYIDTRIPNFIISRSQRNSIKRDGKKSEYNLDIKFLEDLFDDQGGLCALSGFPIILSHNVKENTASLDRIDSNRGYIKGNVQWVHKKVNLIKNILSDKDLYKFCWGITNHRPDLADSGNDWEWDIYNDTVRPVRRKKDLNGEFIIKHPVKEIKKEELEIF